MHDLDVNQLNRSHELTFSYSNILVGARINDCYYKMMEVFPEAKLYPLPTVAARFMGIVSERTIEIFRRISHDKWQTI